MHASSHINVCSSSSRKTSKKIRRNSERNIGKNSDVEHVRYTNLPKEIIELLSPSETGYNWRGIFSAVGTILLILGIIGVTIFLTTPYAIVTDIPRLSLDDLMKISQKTNQENWFTWHKNNFYYISEDGMISRLEFNGKNIDKHLKVLRISQYKNPIDFKISPSGRYWLIKYSPKEYKDQILYNYSIIDTEKNEYTLPGIRFSRENNQIIVDKGLQPTLLEWEIHESLYMTVGDHVYLVKRFKDLSNFVNQENLGSTNNQICQCLTCAKAGPNERFNYLDWRYQRYFSYNEKTSIWQNPKSPGIILTVKYSPDTTLDNYIKIAGYFCEEHGSPRSQCDYNLSYIPAIKKEIRFESLSLVAISPRGVLYELGPKELLPFKNVEMGVYILSVHWSSEYAFLAKLISRDQRTLWIVSCTDAKCRIIYERMSSSFIDFSCGETMGGKSKDFIPAGKTGSFITLLPNDEGRCSVYKISIETRNLVELSPSNRHVNRILEYDQRVEADHGLLVIGEYCRRGTRQVVRISLETAKLNCLSCESFLKSEDTDEKASNLQNNEKIMKMTRNQRTLYMPVKDAAFNLETNILAITWRTGMEPLGAANFSRFRKIIYQNRLTGHEDFSSYLGFQQDEEFAENSIHSQFDHSNGILLYKIQSYDNNKDTLIYNASYQENDECYTGNKFKNTLIWHSVEENKSNFIRERRSMNPMFKQSYRKPNNVNTVEKAPPTDIPLGKTQYIQTSLLNNEKKVVCHSIQRRVNLNAMPGKDEEKMVPVTPEAMALVQFWYPPDLNEKHIIKYHSVLLTNAIGYSKVNAFGTDVVERMTNEMAIYLSTVHDIVVMRPLAWIGRNRHLVNSSSNPVVEVELNLKLLKSLQIEYSQYLNPNKSAVIGIDERNAHLAGLILANREKYAPSVGILMNPINDFSQHDVVLSERIFGQYNPILYTKNILYEELNALKDKPINLFLIHSMNDMFVPFYQSVSIIKRIIQSGENAEFLSYPFPTSSLICPVIRQDLIKRMTSFLLTCYKSTNETRKLSSSPRVN